MRDINSAKPIDYRAIHINGREIVEWEYSDGSFHVFVNGKYFEGTYLQAIQSQFKRFA